MSGTAFRARAQTLLLVGLVAGVAVTVHARALWYPFIQDDWGYLSRALTIDTFQLIQQELSPFTRELYRPIWPLYFLVVGKLFALNPMAAHAVTLTLHVASSLMVVRVLGRITGEPLIGWLGGVLYGGASLVHMDSLLWAAGIFESGSMFLALVSIWCFLEGHTWRGAIAYAGGLLFKESVAFLPLLFVGIALYERSTPMTWRQSLRRLVPFGLVMAAYGSIKLAGPSALALPQDHPYAVRLVGLHLVWNLAMYGRWSVGAFSPTHLLPPVAAAVLLACLGMVLLVGQLARHRSQEQPRRTPSGAILLAIWLLGAMSIYLVLPNHRYRYYLTPALPALIGLMLLSVRAGFDLLRVPYRASVAILIVLTSLSVTSSFTFFRHIARRGLDQPYVEGTNDLVRRAAMVVAVRDGLVKAHPTLAPGTLLLIKGAQLRALDQHSAPRVWYRDPTLHVYDAKGLFHESGQWFVRDPAVSPGDASTGGIPGRVALARKPVLLFELTDQGLVERRALSAPDGSRSGTPAGARQFSTASETGPPTRP